VPSSYDQQITCIELHVGSDVARNGSQHFCTSGTRFYGIRLNRHSTFNYGRDIPKSATRNNARLNMTTPPKLRDLAHFLLAYEADADKTSETAESATLRVYEKLRRSLGAFAGVAGFQSLASRALTLARTEAPSLSTARVDADGALQGLGEN
jgi:hypothetical protein